MTKECKCKTCTHNLGFQPSKNGVPNELLCECDTSHMQEARYSCDNYSPVIRRPAVSGHGFAHGTSTGYATVA